MGMKPTVPEDTLQRWCEYRARRLSEGASLWRIAKELSDSWATGTIYRYLNPPARARDRQLRRQSYQRRKQRDPERQREQREYSRRRREERGDRVRAYERAYRRLTRPSSLAKYLAQVFAERDCLDFHDLLSGMRALTEQRWKTETIEKALRSYMTYQTRSEAGKRYLAVRDGEWYYQRPGGTIR